MISREDVHEFEQINSKINQLASKILYGWKDVPVIFPESITGLANSNKKGDDLKVPSLYSNLEYTYKSL